MDFSFSIGLKLFLFLGKQIDICLQEAYLVISLC